ncbi:AzlC family ABC transporter permease [Pseudomonas plecoglossicida]|uniref:AzlC family ABC transporter permease n=1 Tax=Pseudomonas plecoglossicida TaxID=70775 RepID=UPI003D24B575
MHYRSGKHAFADGARAVLPLTTGVVPFGLITGVTAVGMGMSPLDSLGMTLLFYSGSAQMVVLQLMQNGALPLTMIATALVINLRFLMYSAALAPHLSALPRSRMWPLAYLLSDQSFALCSMKFATAAPGRFAFPYYAGTAIPMWLGWNLSVLTGIFLGTGIPDSWSLGFAIPLSFMALLVPGIRNRATLGAAVVGGALAVLAHDLPYNLGLLVASLGGITAGLTLEHLGQGAPATRDNPEAEAQ